MIRRMLLVMILSFPITVCAGDINLFISVIECESGGNHAAIGDGGKATGIAQFHKDTFYEMAAMAGLKKFDIKNPIHQMRLLNWAMDHNMAYRWSCYRKLTRTGEYNEPK